VCDGFVGNILLKSMEGTFGAVFELLKREFTRSLPAKLAAAVLKPGLKQLKNKLDYTEHGGAPLLGIDGVCIKSHGSSDAIAIKNGIRQARTAVESGLIRSISEGILRK
jgi:glycerol-3-phosphate acyltransferase PlsX